MIKNRFLAAVLLVVAGAFGSASAQTPYCPVTNQSLTIPYVVGSISISYGVCYPSMTDFSSFYWSSTMTYNNVSFDGSFSINGSMGMQLNFASNAVSSVVLSGGPLNYSIGGQPYTVTFNNLTYGLTAALQPLSWTGSLTVNGTNYPADSSYWSYLFR